MNQIDRRLGMDTDITRRDFLNGISVTIGASLLPTSSNAQDIGAQDLPGYYPPKLTRMRGSHRGSFETAHMVRDGKSWDAEDTGEQYDLVVVGGGISGLSAAYFFKQAIGGKGKILIIDNHDDFGGHAKRNEFNIDGRLMIGYGGTMLMDSPDYYPDIAKKLILELGIDTQRFYSAFDQNLYDSLGLSRGIFFDRETFGVDHLAIGNIADPSLLKNIPVSAEGKADLARLFADDRQYLSDLSIKDRLSYLERIDYRTYLKKHVGISDAALDVLRSWSGGVWAIGIDALPATTAWINGYPGFANLDIGLPSWYRMKDDEEEPSIFHFPDGNATITRLLVRNMIPSVASGDNMEDIVTAHFNYRQLDDPKSSVRLRLNSTAIRVRHIDDKLQNPVQVTYLRDGNARNVTANYVVMACYHSMIPYMCPEMPQNQRTALSNSLRAPIVYTNVLIRNWTSFAKLGLQRAHCPSSYHHGVTLDYPVSLGEYHCPKSPEEPMILHLTRVPIQPGLSARDQFSAGKRDLLTTSFETFERKIRDQLDRILGDGGFDPKRDIAGITVNRWPHGYAYGYDPETDNVAFNPSLWPIEKRHWIKGSRRFGNISIAATDAASDAMTESAIEEAHRAINELTEN